MKYLISILLLLPLMASASVYHDTFFLESPFFNDMDKIISTIQSLKEDLPVQLDEITIVYDIKYVLGESANFYYRVLDVEKGPFDPTIVINIDGIDNGEACRAFKLFFHTGHSIIFTYVDYNYRLLGTQTTKPSDCI